MRLFRELLLDLSEADSNFNPFSFAKKAMQGLKNNQLTHQEFDGLANELDFVCKRLKIDTSI